jgi:hypothetical protein
MADGPKQDTNTPTKAPEKAPAKAPMSEAEAETRSAAFAPVDTGGKPVEVGDGENAEDVRRQREALGDVSETSGGQISEEVEHPYDGAGGVRRGVRDEMQNASKKRPIGEPE